MVKLIRGGWFMFVLRVYPLENPNIPMDKYS